MWAFVYLFLSLYIYIYILVCVCRACAHARITISVSLTHSLCLSLSLSDTFCLSVSLSVCLSLSLSLYIYIYVFTLYPARAVIKRSLTGFNLEFSFFYTGCLTQTTEQQFCPTNLPIVGGRITGFITFSKRVLEPCEMQSASFRSELAL